MYVNVLGVNVLGVDLWEQPIPERWKADVLRDVVFHGQSVRIVRSRVGSSHLGEPIGIG